ncbi:MAG TPA: CDP-alcohol phosphatidyltransferase family protein [Bryobacteraceae bacterium]|jgi:CDP-diacylglycerol--glycerol-3-phosphate 3-phosphatidyltransferase|nr:CDP-alcohol phosphatidyltransferase family protein [Bryobacteraceae bacterium]
MLVQLILILMPTLYDLKPRFQGLLRPLVVRLAAAGITANQVTVTTGVASVALGVWLALEHRGWILLPVFLLMRMALNAMDGMLAQEHGQKSRRGAVLNELTDVISDAALTLPFATLPGWNPLAVAGAIFLAALTEMAGLSGVLIGSARRYDGPFGKSDRALALGVLGAWLALGWPVSDWARVVAPAIWLALCCVTIVNRVRRALG